MIDLGAVDDDDKDDDAEDIDVQYMQWGGSQTSRLVGGPCIEYVTHVAHYVCKTILFGWGGCELSVQLD